jgi:hypothetical protein
MKRESLDFCYEHCFTCAKCLYDLGKRTHYCGRDKSQIKNPHTITCDNWVR